MIINGILSITIILITMIITVLYSLLLYYIDYNCILLITFILHYTPAVLAFVNATCTLLFIISATYTYYVCQFEYKGMSVCMCLHVCIVC